MSRKSLDSFRIFCSLVIGVLSLFLSIFSYAQCNNGITAGGFDTAPVGEYAAPNYIGGWKAAGDDRIKIVTQGTSNGALIRNRAPEEFSLEQTIYSVKPSFTYDLSFTYGNWTNGCKTSARAALQIAVYFDDSPIAADSMEYIANDASTASTGTFTFTTPAVISKFRIVITDPGSPKPTCGAVIDDVMLVSPMVISTDATPVICYGDNNGSFSVQASGGAAPYTASYSINGNPSVPFTLTSGQGGVNNLPAGTYTLAITDANNCTVNRTVTIAGPATALTVSTTPVMCYGESSGSVQVSATGGTPGYTYTIGGVSNTTGFFDNLPPGGYTVTVRDQNSCLTSTSFTIGQPSSPLTAQGVATALMCYGDASGSIQATANGGVSPYRFTLNGTTNTTGTFNNLAAGSYTVTVTDANNCVDYVYVTINQPPPIVPTVTKTDVPCFGGAEGTLTVSATGGSGQYTYTVNGITNTSGSFTGLPAGSYTIRTTDQSNSCFVESAITIVQPAAQLTAVATPAKCFGESTGSITVSASGGTPGYTYTLNGISNNTGYFAGLAAGTYSITVQDAQGCQITVTADIGEPTNPLIITASNFNNNCMGGSTGSITAVASGGVPGYTYTLNGTSNTNGVFNNLMAGTYTVLVRDANGCSASTEVIITEPGSAISARATTQGATCFGSTNGSIQVTAIGGSPNYTFSLNGVTNSTGTFTGLAAGDYTIFITDALGCTTSVTATISQPAELLTSTQSSWCFGEASGSVSVSATGGTPGYTYTLNSVTNSTGNFTGLGAGTHNITVRDANNCVTTTTVNLSPPTSPLTAAVTSRKDVTCFGEATGYVYLSANGGVPGYTFTVNGNTNSTGIFNNLVSGNYSAVVADANGCRTTINFQILENSTQIRPTIVTAGVGCYGDATGTIQVSATGGSPGYNFTVNGSTNTTGTFTGLRAGTYTVFITDQNSCTVSITGNITEPTATLTAVAQPLKCGSTNGSIFVTASGGAPGYTYHLNGISNTTGQFNNLPSGTYQIMVTDANSCSDLVMATLSEPDSPLIASVSSQVNVSCYGSATGSVQLNARGGAPGYTYTLNGTSNSNGTFTGLAGGTYTIRITDMNGCSVDQAVTITQPATPLAAAEVSVTPVTCSSDSNGSVKVTATGGTPPYRFTLNGITNTSGIFLNLPTGTYMIMVTDANNCTLTVPGTIPQLPPVAVTAISTDVTCFGDSSGRITARATGGVSGYTYTLNGLSNQTGQFNGLPAGSYVIYVNDGNGCTAMTQGTIRQPLALTAIATKTDLLQPGLTNGTTTITASGGTPSYTFALNDISNPTGRFTDLAAGDYVAKVTDSRGCTISIPVSIEVMNRVDLTPALTITPEGKKVTVTAQLREPFKEDVLVDLKFTGNASAKLDYLLTDQFRTIRIPKGAITTTEKVTIHALSDALTEADEDIQISIVSTSNPLVQIGDGAVVIIQDVIPDDPLIDNTVPENKDLFPDPLVSPNEDGEGNDFFNIGNIVSFPDNEVIIFNRWGNVVFRVKGYNTTDRVFKGFANTGLLANAPKPLVDGVYYYVIYSYKTVQSVKERRLNKGYLILRR